ncbi:MAG TPA: BON domain-containing protein [Acidimicrobiales bacterium]|nr:BON domain-containing protein [Acidimicrobiales bacterium]
MSPVMKRIVSAAVILLCGVAACASGPKTAAQLQADKETAERVETALNADRALYAKHITARADNGVVRLSGYVWEAADLQLAMAIAEGVPGVSRVISDLELNRNGDADSPVTR